MVPRTIVNAPQMRGKTSTTRRVRHPTLDRRGAMSQSTSAYAGIQ